MKNTVNFALVGLGSLTLNQLLPAFAKCKYCQVTGLVSGDLDKAEQQAKKYNISPKNIYSLDHFDSVKDNPEIDVIYIVLPTSMHAQYTLRAAKAGKHVLCEKPMAASVVECNAMIDACKTAKKKLMIAYRMRYEPLTRKLIALARSANDIGRIQQITAEAGFIHGNDPTAWRLNRKLACGGPLYDMGIYALQAIRYLSGQEPIEVSAMWSTNPDDPRFKDVEETLTLQMRFKSGMLASLLSSYNINCNRFRLYGEKGMLESEPMQYYDNNRGFITRKNSAREEIEYTQVDHFAAEMDHMARCVLDDNEPLTPGEEGLQDVKIMLAAYESIANGGKPVNIS